MNTYDDTIQMLLQLVRQEQRNHDATHSPDLKEDADRQFRALMEQLREDPELRRTILHLTDTQTYLEGLHSDFHFRAGVQIGLALGSIGVLQEG